MQLKFINYYSGFTEEWKLSSEDGKTLYLFKKIFFLSKIIYMHTYIYYTCIYIHTYLHMHTYMHTYIHAHPLWARYTMGGCPIHSRMFTIIIDDIEEIISVKCKGTMRWPPNETQSWGRVKTGIMWCWHVFFVI